MSNTQSDRNLLVGILALQFCLVSRDQLIAAMGAWVLNKSLPLDDLLAQQGGLTSENHAQLKALVELHLQNHGNSPERSLAAVNALNSVRQELAGLKDSDVTLSLMRMPENDPATDDPIATAHYSAGQSSSEGTRFRVLRPHARGGLGEVSVALDTELNREVALKEIQLRYADKVDSRARFVAEAEITGGLEHPSIVPVYGLGTYADGRPFYAMRFIRGDSLQEAVNRYHDPHRKLSTADRSVEFRNLLQQFIHVCNAIEYAHSRGVLHRDLKPGNIMLGKYGETLVVDWGLAKVLGTVEHPSTATELPLEPVSGSGSAPTQYGSAMGTPAFMSPEQAAGELDKLGPATDVYGLGATLYYMLTRKPPVEGSDVGEVLRKVQAGEIIPPRRIQPSVAPALEAICLQAMALNRHQRYTSAKALAKDVECWLADEPVDARHDTPMERTFRWIRHNRSWAIAGSVSTIVIAVLAVASAIQIANEKSKTESHRADAVRRLQESRETVDTWLTGTSEVLEYFPGVQVVRQRLLQQAVERYAKFAADDSDDPDVAIERSRALLRLGDAHKLLGQTQGASDSYAQALAALSSRIDANPSDIASRLELANCQLRRGVLSLELGNIEVADGEFAQSITTLSTASVSPRSQRLTSAALVNRAICMREQGDLSIAEKLARQSVQILQSLAKSDNSEAELTLELARSMRILSEILSDRGSMDEAMQVLTLATVEAGTAAAKHSDNTQLRDESASGQIALAIGFGRRGEHEKEQAAYLQAIEDYQSLLKALPDVPRYRESLALTQTDLAQALHNVHRNKEAEDLLKQALIETQQLAADYSQIRRYRQELATNHGVLGQVLFDFGRFDDALSRFNQADRQFADLSLEEPKHLSFKLSKAIMDGHAAKALFRLDRTAESNSRFRQAISSLEEMAIAENGNIDVVGSLGYVHFEFGMTLHLQKDEPGAKASFERAVKLWSDLSASSSAVNFETQLAWLFVTCPIESMRRPERARAMADAWQKRGVASVDARLIDAAALVRQKDFAAAVASLKDWPYRADARHSLLSAIALHHLGDVQGSRRFLKEGGDWISQNCPGSLELNQLQQEAIALIAPESKVD